MASSIERAEINIKYSRFACLDAFFIETSIYLNVNPEIPRFSAAGDQLAKGSDDVRQPATDRFMAVQNRGGGADFSIVGVTMNLSRRSASSFESSFRRCRRQSVGTEQ